MRRDPVWTERMDRVLRELWPQRDIPASALAERFGVTERAVNARASDLKLPPRKAGWKRKDTA